MIDAVMFDVGGASMKSFVMPDASGLTPLSLPEAVLARLGSRLAADGSAEGGSGGSDNSLPRPSSDAIRRFESAMGGETAPLRFSNLRAGLGMGAAAQDLGPVPKNLETVSVNTPHVVPPSRDGEVAAAGFVPASGAALGTDPAVAPVLDKGTDPLEAKTQAPVADKGVFLLKYQALIARSSVTFVQSPSQP